MSRVIFAIVEDGLFKPEVEIGLSPGTKVRLTVETFNDAMLQQSNALDTLDALCDQFPVDCRGERLTREQLHDRH